MTDQPVDGNAPDKDPDARADAQLQELLDELLQPQQAAPAYLSQRILANLPTASPAQDIFSWLTSSLWRSAWVAALPLVLGFVMGITVSLNDNSLADELDVEALVFAQHIEEFEVDEY